MRHSPSSSDVGNTLKGHKDLLEKFGLSKEAYHAYVGEKGWNFKAEDIRTVGKHEWMAEDHASQEYAIEVTGRSKLYPDIVSRASLDLSVIKIKQQEEQNNERVINWIYYNLASACNNEIHTKELAYRSALEKEQLIAENADWLNDNKLKIEKLSLEKAPIGYKYHVAVRSLEGNKRGGKSFGLSLDEALKKALIDLRDNEEYFKKIDEELWKTDPEYMYLRTEYDDKFEKLGFKICNWHKGEDDYLLELSLLTSIDPTITIRASSWENAFEEAYGKAQRYQSNNRGYLNVTDFSMKGIAELFSGNSQERHEDYQKIKEETIEDRLNNGEEPGFEDKDLLELKEKALQTEKYELAAKISLYLKKKKGEHN